MEENELIAGVGNYGLKALAKERALYFLSKAGSWNYVNSLFTRLILLLFDTLDRGDIEKIIKMPLETGADLIGADEYSLFVNRVRKSDLLSDFELNQLLTENGVEYLVPQVEEA